MNLLTHIGMSKTLHQHLEAVIQLDKKSFVYGNIKPDLSLRCYTMPHIQENYLKVVLRMAEELEDEIQSFETFSEKLGIICHYLSDFFCYYHSDHNRFKKHFMHFLYEVCLQVKFRIIRNQIDFSAMLLEPTFVKEVPLIISEMKTAYDREKHTLTHDLIYALRTATLVSHLIYQNATIKIADEETGEGDLFAGLSV